ncbi:ABC transporter substrate-binding protein [Paracoccus cavernae]|uniref:ABC transporter substrate-binding protein n=1 Tax=Paracoccus cavernae TaxID=1571207 RepID=A0ABT8D869_9RHOB|nr:ABC transporter substrate-binding protein [Paracoccus cavernae]
MKKALDSVLRHTFAPVLAGLLLSTSAFAADLTIAVQDIPDVLDPPYDNSNVNERIMLSLFDTLIITDYRDGGKLKPGLATEWTVIDPQTIEFKLRDGVSFHNGDGFDAKDVAFTFRTCARARIRVLRAPFCRNPSWAVLNRSRSLIL